MNAARRYLILCSFAAFVSAGCHEVPDAATEIHSIEEGLSLVPPFKSLMTPEEAAMAMHQPVNLEKMRRDYAPKEGPDFVREATLEFSNATLLGIDGKLTLIFYHDRLAKVFFVPEQYDRFLQALGAKPGFRGTLPTEGPLKIHVHGSGIVWRDQRVSDVIDKVVSPSHLPAWIMPRLNEKS
jgi:hypothetical protein